MERIQTTLTSMADDIHTVMTGNERYPIIGKRLHVSEMELLMKRCHGRNLYWDCIEKANLVRQYFNSGMVVVGSCQVTSKTSLSSYGHAFNPPFELHAWWTPRLNSRVVVDIAMPGLILKGSKMRDEVGPFLVGREPAIVAGVPPKWIYYSAEDFI